MTPIQRELERLPEAWKTLEAALAERDPKLLATLRPPLDKTHYQKTTTTWFRAHDGQKPSARPLHGGFRLLSFDEGRRAWDRARGLSYRPDWNDSWIVVGRDHKMLLCYDPSTTIVWLADISAEKYTKKRLCLGLAKWLETAAKCV
jgi:hypothetical protein